MSLYKKLLEIDELVTKHYLKEDDTKEEMLKKLDRAYWRATNSNYCNYMAGKGVAGINDTEMEEWDFACSNKYRIDYLWKVINESKE